MKRFLILSPARPRRRAWPFPQPPRNTGGHNKAKIRLEAYTLKRVVKADAQARALEGERDTRWPGFIGIHVFKVVERLLRLPML